MPERSFNTPILILPSENAPAPWASATPVDKAASAVPARMDLSILFIFFPIYPVLLFALIDSLHAQIFVQLRHIGFELVIRDHVDDVAFLHHVVPVRDSGGEAEVLLDQQDGQAALLQLPHHPA